MPADRLRDELQTSLGDSYTVDEELGGGGMSRVFVATDRMLGRRVVVKVPQAELAGDVALDRFEREITVAARLQHPHIVPLISAGSTPSGAPFYTMPFVPGQSLRERIEHGAIPAAEAMRILRDVASALAYAHSEGIVHRDIKPANVLLHDDSAVVTDFGIAKARDLLRGTSGVRAGTLTDAGVSLGTPAYMAPEQAAGDDVDHRADIYAWGLIAYEMLSGAHPFADRTTAQQLIVAHIADEPAPLDVPEVSADVAVLIMRCLAKNADARPQSARALVHALDGTMSGGTRAGRPFVRVTRARRAAIAVGIALVAIVAFAAVRHKRANAAAAPAAPSIAVLSFENATHDTASDYFVDGLADELRSRLTNVRGLSVKGRASSAQFVGHVDSRDVARRLGVNHLLTGVVRRAAGRVHVTAELDDVSSDDAILSVSYDRDIQDVASIQDSIVARVASRFELGDSPATVGATRETSDFEAYDDFLQGQHAFARLDFARAAARYREAVQRDPSYARAWASLTIALISEPRSGVVPADSALDAAKVSLARAVALDPKAPLVRVADASVRGALFEFPRAAAILADVIARDPQDVFAQQQYIYMLGCLGRMSDAVAVLEQLRQLDPENPFTAIAHEYLLIVQHRFREAADVGLRDLELRPGDRISLRNVSQAYSFLGKPDSAVLSMEAAWRGDSVSFGAPPNLMMAYAAAGRWSDVDRLEADRQRHSRGNSPRFEMAMFDIANGRYDSAMRNVEAGVAAREPMFGTAWLPCDPDFDVLKRDPRFTAVVQSFGGRMCPAVGRWPIPVRPR